MKRFLILSKAMFWLTTRNRTTLFWNLAFPIFLLVIYSLVFSQMQVDGQNYMAWVVPGVLVFNIMAFGLINSGTQIVTMRDAGVLNRLRASPLPPVQLVSSYVLMMVMVGLIQCLLILGVGAVFYGLPFKLSGLLLTLPMLVFAILTSVAIGQTISGVVASAGAAVAIAQVINFSQMFISDLVMPMQMMPAWIQKIAPYLPAYAIVKLVRPPLIDGTYGAETLTSLLVLALYALLAILLAARFFRWEPKV